MSYQLAVWDGDRPIGDEEAGEAFDRVTQRIGSGEPPSFRIRGFVEELLQRWPEDDDHLDEAPWAAGPLINEAAGDAISFAVVPSRAAEVAAYAAALAAEHGLVCYDPQQGALLSAGFATQPDDEAPPRSVRDWLTWLRRTIFG